MKIQKSMLHLRCEYPIPSFLLLRKTTSDGSVQYCSLTHLSMLFLDTYVFVRCFKCLRFNEEGKRVKDVFY